MTGEWIEHHGKGYPDLPMDTLVQVRFADGEYAGEWGQTVEFWAFNWRHFDDEPHPADITHYRVVTK